MALFGLNIISVSQSGHRASDHNRIGIQHFADGCGGHGFLGVAHVDQNMQHPPKSLIVFHVFLGFEGVDWTLS